MRIAVVGAGIVGVTTAYELASDGHEVSVFERHGSVAAGASFANAGLMAAGLALPWCPVRGLRDALAVTRGDHAPVRAASRWRAVAGAMRLERSPSVADDPAGFAALARLTAFSQERLHDLTRRLRLDHEGAEGVLVLLRDVADQARIAAALPVLQEAGIRHELLDSEGCRHVEPGLHPETALYGGIHLPDGETGNGRQFANLLRAAAQRLGVRLRYHTEVQAITPGQRPQLTRRHAPPKEPVMAVATPEPRPGDDMPTRPMAFDEQVTETFDAVIVCAAAESTRLLAPLGLRLPLASSFGYSITAPIRYDEHHPERPPRAAVVDLQRQVSVSRVGERIRVSGVTEIGGRLDKLDPAALDSLYKTLHDWFPGVAKLPHALPWKGVRSQLPDLRPAIGRASAPGVWVNLGHGDRGWALACGAACALADDIAGRRGVTDPAAFSPGRFG